MPDPRSRYLWDAAAARYRSASTGRFVGRDAVVGALNRAITSEGVFMTALLKDLRDKKVTLDAWYFSMRQSVKLIHLWAAAAGKGGWAQLDQADYGYLGAIVRFHYGRLARFAAQLALGLPIGAREVFRVGMYAQAARATFNDLELGVTAAAGYTEERSVRDPSAESCAECEEIEARGWAPIGSLPRIGDRTCLTNCRCFMEYRRSGEDG